MPNVLNVSTVRVAMGCRIFRAGPSRWLSTGTHASFWRTSRKRIANDESRR